jgi:hypothetical protein
MCNPNENAMIRMMRTVETVTPKKSFLFKSDWGAGRVVVILLYSLLQVTAALKVTVTNFIFPLPKAWSEPSHHLPHPPMTPVMGGMWRS